jgi:3-phosphoshikimate 1-carboxyvinyltransferase
MALVAPESSRLRNAAILRNKESDRLAFICELVEQAGGTARLENDEIEIDPAVEKMKKVRVDSQEDHRRVMSAACLVALGWPSVEIDDIGPVAKSFPGFWQEVAKAGIMVEEI